MNQNNPKNKFKIDDLDNFILQWNIDFPIDRWWRKTHGVAFNSSVHREISVIDQSFEFLEDQLYKENSERIKRIEEDPYVAGQGNFLFVKNIEQQLSDTAFNDLDLTIFDE